MISIVVPAVDEADALAATLAAATAQEPPFEIVLADGGSRDDTRRIAERRGARVIESPRGRAVQMNAGAAAAAGDVLLFLHADTLLPRGGLAAVRAAVARGADAGGFRLLYDRASVGFRAAAWLSDVYCRWTGNLFGDRAVFVRRDVFHALGGYRPLAILEDLDLAIRLRAAGHRIELVRPSVVTSARRYAEIGIWRGGWRAWRLVRDFRRGRPLDQAAVSFFAETGPRSP
jgi:rSAM/selenodomain-associated transferase 2